MIGLTQILINEGGNVKGVNSFVDNRFSKSTKSVINKIKFKPKYSMVGSVDKKISGDVDLAVDWKDAPKVFKTDKKYGFWDRVDKYLKTKPVDYEIMKGLGQFSVVVMVDDSGKVQKVVKDRQGTLGRW